MLCVVRTPDGTGSTPAARILAEAHVGPLAGLHPLPGVPGHVVSAGVDGTLRVWQVASGSVSSRRTFSSAQTSLAVATVVPIAVIGSGTGVLRVVGLSVEESRPLPVLFRWVDERMGMDPMQVHAWTCVFVCVCVPVLLYQGIDAFFLLMPYNPVALTISEFYIF